MGKITALLTHNRALICAVAALTAAAFVVAPAVAKPPPAGIWEQYHFRDARDAMHIVTQQVQIVRADYAETACGVDLQKHRAAEAAFVAKSHPEVAGMTFVSADCATDKSGKIKVAVGLWPGGFRPSVTVPVKPVDPDAGLAKDAAEPAVVLMTFRFITGTVKTYRVSPRQDVQPLDMQTCPARLNGLLPGLTRAVTFRSGGTLLSATCAPMNIGKK